MHLARKNCGTQNNGAFCAPSCDLRLWFLHVHFVCNYCVMSCDSVNASRSTHCSFYAMQISRPRSAARKLLIWSDGSWDYMTSELLDFKTFLSMNIIKHVSEAWNYEEYSQQIPQNPVIIVNMKATSHHSQIEISIVWASRNEIDKRIHCHDSIERVLRFFLLLCIWQVYDRCKAKNEQKKSDD